MLKKRSTATSKQALMADYTSIPSPTDNYRNPISSIFSSQKLFTNFASKGLIDYTESVLSPTSTLDTKSFSPVLRNPFWSDPVPKTQKSPNSENKNIPWDEMGSKKVGLGIVDDLTVEISDPKFSKPQSRKVLFGSQLKIQIPILPSSVLTPAQSPKSPGDFGIKTRNSQLGFFSPSPGRKSPFACEISSSNSPRVSTGCLSASEMELLEEYTCVISRGPNPKTTHIFDDCIVESCCGVSAGRKENQNGMLGNRSMSYPSESFLSFCYNCKKNLDQGKDIYMYRGEKAFCSSECRSKEMMLEEEMEEKRSDDVHGASP